MRRAVILTMIFLLASLSPLANAATTETQFEDGTTGGTFTFTGTGDGHAGILKMPIGAEVTNAEFNLRGEASTTSWINYTTDTHYGGTGDGSWSSSPPSPFSSGSRQNVNVESQTMSLKGVSSVSSTDLSNSNSISSLGGAYHNTTGAFVALGDQGYVSGLKQNPTLSVSSSASWSYVGVTVPVSDDEIHVFRYTSSSPSGTPTIQRFNSSSGAYLGTASLSTGSCTSSVKYWIVDATISNGTAYTAHYSYDYLAKWTVSNTSWTCQNYWTYSYPNYPTGVDVDESTGKLYVTIYNRNTQVHELREVNPSSPTSTNASWTLTSSSLGREYGAGLVVSGNNVIYNFYDSSDRDSTHIHFKWDGLFLNSVGEQPIAGGGHFGLVHRDGGDIRFACHHTSYCSSQYRQIYSYSTPDYFDARNPTSTTATVVGTTQTLSGNIDLVKLSGVFGETPTGTSIDVDLSNDGGLNWYSVTPGTSLTFPSSNNKLTWRATLNGTSSATPIFAGLSVLYTSSYQSSGYLYNYQWSSGQSSVVAATVTWNGTTPAGTSITVNFGFGSSSCSSTSSSIVAFTQSNQTKAVQGSSSYMCVRVMLSTTNSGVSPSITDLQIQRHSHAPKEVGIELDNISAWKRDGQLGALMGPTTVSQTSSGGIVQRLNALIEDTGSGFNYINVDITTESSGIVILESFSVTYTMQTINLAIDIPEGEILHERSEPYEVVTRHVIGEDASAMTSATLTLMTNMAARNPTMTWENGDIFPEPNDPEDYIEIDSNSYSVESNGILEIHWIFHVTGDFPDQNDVKFRTGCLDNSGSAGYAPVPLMSETGLRVNRTFGLGWLAVRDNDGELTLDDVPDGSWVRAGEQLLFQGAMWFMDSDDAPKDSAFDVRVSRNGWVEGTARDTSNHNGSFLITIDLPTIDVPDGLNYEVQTYNEKNPAHVQEPNSEWSRTYRVDATAPERMDVYPQDDAYEAANREQDVKIHVNDDVGHPMTLKLMYWVEADHDLNRNGEPDANEYVSKLVHNNSVAKDKWFMTTIDHSRNPNMGRVSYYWDGGDQAGNPIHFTVPGEDDEILVFEAGPGFNYDDATFRTRKDSSAIFTGLDWLGHEDDAPVYAGTKQTITLGFIDANTAIDFEHISLVFDFEGPNPDRDAQRISYSGVNDTFWSESKYIDILTTSNMYETTNDSGLPWIMVTFEFEISWDWPDEEMGDVALVYKERGSSEDSRILLLEHTFRVENDLMLSPTDFSVEDVSEPRTGPIADGSRVRKDDRLEFTGRVVYEGSDVPAPRDVGILIEVFDGEKTWSDGSIGEGGEYSVEVPLDRALTLQSSPTRTCLISVTNIPGRGEDMTGTAVSTTLRVVVDDAAPRVTRRVAPLNVIDISGETDLSNVPVEFTGTEDADLTGSKQMVHWVMRDATRTITIGAGSSLLGMQKDGQSVIWTGHVDLTDGGRIIPNMGDFVGFYITGWDAAGNQFPVVSNSEASPIPELAVDDTDFERQWVRLGAVGAELRIKSMSLSDDHVAPGESVKVEATIINSGGLTNQPFKVAFFAGDSDTPFDSVGLQGIGAGEEITIDAFWEAEDVDRVRVVVDYGDLINEANDDDNSAEHSVEIAYGKYMGWLDSPKENPLVWIFVVVSIIAVVGAIRFASKTSIDYGEGAFSEDEDWEDDEDEDWEDDDEEEDDDDY